MEKKEAEAKILEYMLKIKAVLKDFNPESTYFTASIMDSSIMFNTRYWDGSEEKSIEFYCSDVDVTQERRRTDDA